MINAIIHFGIDILIGILIGTVIIAVEPIYKLVKRRFKTNKHKPYKYEYVLCYIYLKNESNELSYATGSSKRDDKLTIDKINKIREEWMIELDCKRLSFISISRL